MKLSTLTSVEKAHDLIAARCKAVDVERVSLAKATGRILCESVRADRPIPPFNRSAMDGYAVRSGDFTDGKAELVKVADIPAGTEWDGRIGKGQCASIMTGAPVPKGADAVVKVEQTKTCGDRVLLEEPKVEPCHNIHRHGADARKGQVLIAPGRPIGQGEIGVASSVGAHEFNVSRRIDVGVLSTGREVVRPSATPTPYQIRDANSPTLLSALAMLPWCRGHRFGIAPDSEKPLERLIRKALDRCDVLLVSGGVSMGEFDLVPDVLSRLGVRQAFHGIAIRPGKPLWFGASKAGKLVFGLPGNPVSVRVSLREFVTHALRRMAQFADPIPPALTLPLAEDFRKKHDLTAFSLGRIATGPSSTQVEPVPHEGSGDFVSAALSDGVFVVPADTKSVTAGELVEFHAWHTH